jgi:pimeloyl-ACP methyl ester carboxylesterase
METREVVVGGVRSPVLVGGSGAEGEAVVFVHGNPVSAHDWEFALGPVAELARVIAPDMPAFGGADRPAELPYTVRGYADHLAGILDELRSPGHTSCCTTSAGRGGFSGPGNIPRPSPAPP